MSRLTILMAVCVAMLCSCSAFPGQASATPSPSVPPTPTLRPAVAFVPGENEIPAGEYLFVEYFTWNDGVASADTGLCPYAAMIDFPGYSFSDGRLSFPGMIDDDAGLLGFVGDGMANLGDMGGGISSQVIPIRELPFLFANGISGIHAAYADGTVVAEILGRFFLLGPGEAWHARYESDPSPDCHATTTTRLTNYGLLPREAISGLP